MPFEITTFRTLKSESEKRMHLYLKTHADNSDAVPDAFGFGGSCKSPDIVVRNAFEDYERWASEKVVGFCHASTFFQNHDYERNVVEIYLGGSKVPLFEVGYIK
jgi:hypothetical protein